MILEQYKYKSNPLVEMVFGIFFFLPRFGNYNNLHGVWEILGAASIYLYTCMEYNGEFVLEIR